MEVVQLCQQKHRLGRKNSYTFFTNGGGKGAFPAENGVEGVTVKAARRGFEDKKGTLLIPRV